MLQEQQLGALPRYTCISKKSDTKAVMILFMVEPTPNTAEGMAHAGGLAQPKGHPAAATASTPVTSCPARDSPAPEKESQAPGLSAQPLHATCPTPSYAFPFEPWAHTAATVYFGCSHGILIKE